METPPKSKSPAALHEGLRACLRSFLTLYDLRRDVFVEAAACLWRAGESGNPVSDGGLAVALPSMLGGGLGAVVGGVSGGLWGGLGTVGAAACCRLCGKVNAVQAFVGFFGGALGGLIGGVFSSTVGCAVEVAFVAWGRRIDGALSSGLRFSIGCATGGAMGSIFGGFVGAAGGAVGGGLGALHARAVAVHIAAGTYSSQEKGPGRTETVKMLQTSLRRFSGVVASLAEELQSVQTLCGQMESGGTLLHVTAQTANTLAAVCLLQDSLSDCQEAASQSDSAPCWKEGARRSLTALEELKKMKVKVETQSFTDGETEESKN